MAVEDDRGATMRERRGTLACLAGIAAFAGFDAETLAGIARDAVSFCLPAGATLFAAGADSDGIYLVTSGRLGVTDAARPAWSASVGAGDFVGEVSWLLGTSHSATAVAQRDTELLWLTPALLQSLTQQGPELALALARLCARRLHETGQRRAGSTRARVFVIVPHGIATASAQFATDLVAELSGHGRTELVWDARASSHTTHWFNAVEERNDFVVYLADSHSSGWTRQCCRQADMLLLTVDADAPASAWPELIAATAARPGVRVELALLHRGALRAGAASSWLGTAPARRHHHIVGATDVARTARLLAGRGVGLVLSGGGARGFAHLGCLQALREARVPVDCVAGSSIGSIIAAGIAMGWNDAEMRERFQRTFVTTNPLSDYTFPLVALTRGRKVTRLLHEEFGDVAIEDLPLPFFCVSADLSTGRVCEHRAGPLYQTLRASVAIPGIMPPVFQGSAILVDGAAINNLPIDLMQLDAPGFIVGSDASAISPLRRAGSASGDPPFWRFFNRTRGGKPRLNIFRLLMESSMVGGESTAAAQREHADLILRPPLLDVELLDWQSFARIIDSGYRHTQAALGGAAGIPRLPVTVQKAWGGAASLRAEIARRSAAMDAPSHPDGLAAR
jgi:NTE family protein